MSQVSGRDGPVGGVEARVRIRLRYRDIGDGCRRFRRSQEGVLQDDRDAETR